MIDNVSKETRSRIMSRIRSNKTKPELILRKVLRGMGFSYQPKVFGRPDFINYSKKEVIFVDGCFWHACLRHYKVPKTNRRYWIPKILRNQLRAEEINRAYKSAGWKAIRVWEHDLNKGISLYKWKQLKTWQN